MENLHYLRDLTPKEVFKGWAENEENNTEWQAEARRQGWPEWSPWRSYMAETLFKFSKRDWRLYQIVNPQQQIPNFLVGPFSSWQAGAPSERITKITFEECYKLDQQKWATNGKIHKLMESFTDPLSAPKITQIIGLKNPFHSEPVCIEGSHQCMAITKAKIEERQVSTNLQVIIAMADISPEETDLLLNTLRIGAINPQIKTL